jgi:hypothetical protein
MGQTVIPQLQTTQATMRLPCQVDGLRSRIDWRHRFEPGFPLFAQLSHNGQTQTLSEPSNGSCVGGAVSFSVSNHETYSQDGVGSTVMSRGTVWCALLFSGADPNCDTQYVAMQKRRIAHT